MPPLQLSSVITEDGNLTVSLLTGGEIVAKRSVPRCLPINYNGRGHIVEFGIVFLSVIGGRFVPTTESLITPFDVTHATHFIDESINGIVTDCLTTTAILFIIGNEIVLITLIDELQHVIQSIVLIEQFLDLANSVSSEAILIVGGQGHGHGRLWLTEISIRGQGGVWCDPVPLVRVSHTPVGVVSDDHPILADLSVSEILRQGEAEIPCPIEIRGALALVGGGGNVDSVAGHQRLSELRSV